jgi:hypothetical protein
MDRTDENDAAHAHLATEASTAPAEVREGEGEGEADMVAKRAKREALPPLDDDVIRAEMRFPRHLFARMLPKVYLMEYALRWLKCDPPSYIHIEHDVPARRYIAVCRLDDVIEFR